MQRTWIRHLTLALVMIGCGGGRGDDDGGGDARNDGGTRLRCAALEDDLLAAIATRGTCETDQDCTLVAGPRGFACDGETSMLDCGGIAIERNAPGVARAEALKQTFFDTDCDEGPGAFDCAPRLVQCGADHRCTGMQRSCLPPPPPRDAGIDATITVDDPAARYSPAGSRGLRGRTRPYASRRLTRVRREMPSTAAARVWLPPH